MTRPARPDLAPHHVVSVLSADRLDHVRLELTAVAAARRHLAVAKAARTAPIVESASPRDPSGGPLMRWVRDGVHTTLRWTDQDEMRATLRCAAILGADDAREDAMSVDVDLCGASMDRLGPLIGDETSSDGPWIVAATAEARLFRMHDGFEPEPPPAYVSTLRGLAWEAHAAMDLPPDLALRVHAPAAWARAAFSVDRDVRTGAESAWSAVVEARIPDEAGIDQAVRLFVSGNPGIRSARTIIDPWSTTVDPTRDGPVSRLRDLAALAEARNSA